ncbi:MAG: hypothetical protein KO202_06180 [Methanobacteriaceae archaeon]|jgi:uncharacterized protein YcfL|nr:hypothetical protein [Methanobacteriaceae archaeon]
MVRCPRCTYENDDKSKYCLDCKYPLDSNKKVKKRNDIFSKWENFSQGKKIIFAVFLLLIIVFTFNLIYTLSMNLNAHDSEIITTNKSSLVQSTNPFQVKVIYNGSWYGEMGIVDNSFSKSGSGNELIFIHGGPWENVTATVYKNDESDKNLTVQIIKDQQVIMENSTNKPNGKVSLLT